MSLCKYKDVADASCRSGGKALGQSLVLASRPKRVTPSPLSPVSDDPVQAVDVAASLSLPIDPTRGVRPGQMWKGPRADVARPGVRGRHVRQRDEPTGSTPTWRTNERQPMISSTFSSECSATLRRATVLRTCAARAPVTVADKRGEHRSGQMWLAAVYAVRHVGQVRQARVAAHKHTTRVRRAACCAAAAAPPGTGLTRARPPPFRYFQRLRLSA
jgi:hypothetical protein